MVSGGIAKCPIRKFSIGTISTRTGLLAAPQAKKLRLNRRYGSMFRIAPKSMESKGLTD